MDLEHVCVLHKRWFRNLRIYVWRPDYVRYQLVSHFFGIKQAIEVQGAPIDEDSYWYELFQKQKEDILQDDARLLEHVYELDQRRFQRTEDAGPKVVVYGGSGFFGRLVVRELLEHTRAAVVVASRDPKFIDFGPYASRVKFYFSDVRNEASVREMLEGARVLICCAGPYQEMPVSLLQACIDKKVHYVDVADDRDFVERAYALKPLIEEAGDLPVGQGHSNACFRQLASSSRFRGKAA